MKNVQYTVDIVEKLLNQKSVIMDDFTLDYLEANSSLEIRSYPNPRQIGTKDRWLCWVGEADTLEGVLARVSK